MPRMFKNLETTIQLIYVAINPFKISDIVNSRVYFSILFKMKGIKHKITTPGLRERRYYVMGQIDHLPAIAIDLSISH